MADRAAGSAAPGRDVAVVGIAARFPQAANLGEFLANLRAGRDSVREIPAERVAATFLDPAGDYGPLGYLDRIDRFDPEFFGLSRREAELMDPQHRVALELAQGAVEDAGYRPSALRGTRTAVVFSSPTPGYAALLSEVDTLAAVGNMPAGLPSRIAHLFGLTGPCYGIDTGCNAALVAVHHACRELRAGDAEHALVGGVSIRPVPPSRRSAAGFAGVVAASGRCRSFDHSADGAAGGEGGAVLLLTTMDTAVRDGLPVYAVIRGSSVLHNGFHASTISTPSPAAQADVITAAWRFAGRDPALAGYVEAHGSGTRLGDAIEVEGLALARPGAAGRLPIGSVKSNIGHLDHAAGIAGLVKAVLSVHHGELFPSLHFERPADGVDLDAAGLEVLVTGRPWPAQDRPRLAGVSSFSLGGINAHCVLEQAPPPPVTLAPGREPALVGVSARTLADLTALCERLAVELRSGTAPFADVVRTLTEGRDHHRQRVAMVASHTAELAGKLAEQVTWLRLDGDQAAATAPRVVLLLSRDAEPAEATEPDARLPLTGALGELVAAQLRAHDLLARSGVRVEAMLSSGVSRYAVRLIRDQLSTVDKDELAAFDSAGTGDLNRPADPAKLRAAADELITAGPVVFVELGGRGELSDLLRTHLHGRADAEVLAIPAESGPLALLGELYRRGVDLDWAALARPGARRVSLPGYSFQGPSCWIQPTTAPARPEPVVTPAPEPAVSASPQPVLSWLRTTLADLLHADTVAEEADYFELGGNSIIAQQLVNRISDQYGCQPKMLDIYEHAKVSQLALLIEKLAGPTEPEPGELPPILPSTERVLSFGQERMWFHHQLEPDTTLYNLPVTDRLLGPLDLDAVRLAWEDLAARHEALRTNFVEHDGRPELVIRPGLGDFFQVVDLSGIEDENAKIAEATALVAADCRRGFDLATEPLVRLTVIRLADQEHLLQYTMHHAVNDGWAPTIMQREFLAFYEARRSGTVHELPALPVRYRDYAKWQRDLLASSALDGELEYWRRTLRDAPALELRTDRPRPAQRDYAGQVITFTIPAELVVELRAVGQRESATLFMVLLAGLNLLLAARSGQDDIIVGTPTLGRTRPELWDVIGFFNNTIALRTDLSGRPTFGELVRRVRTVLLGALDHQELPFDKVVKEVAPQRGLNRNPIIDVLYIHQVLPAVQSFAQTRQIRFDGGGSGFGGLPVGTAKFDLTLVVGERADADDLEAGLEFSTQLFDEATAAGMVQEFLDLLWSAVRPQPAIGADDLAYWRAVLAGAPALALPTDRPRPAVLDGATGVHVQPVPAAMAEDLRDFALAESASVADVLLAGLVTMLARRCNQDDLLVGVGRLAVRADLGDEPGFRTLLRRLRQQLAIAEAHGSTALSQLAAELGGSALDVCLTDQPSTVDGLAQSWTAMAEDDQLTLAVQFATGLFDYGTVAVMAEQLVSLLRAALREPETAVMDLRPVQRQETEISR